MRVLVSAASRHESTTEIAGAIGAVLRGSGHDVDVLAPADVTAVERYDAVVLGSAIYAGRWLDPATTFIDRNREALAHRPVWLFSSGPIGDPPLPSNQEARVLAIGRDIAPREHRIFSGRLERTRLGFLERTITSALKAPDGDYRPWEEIRQWATKIAASLAAEPFTATAPAPA